jgi:hypothetical protein
METQNNIEEQENYLVNFKNYYCYADMVRDKVKKVIYVPGDITFETISDHIDGITAILKDGVETEFVHTCTITISWGGDIECDLSIVDYWYNLFMWTLLIKIGMEIKPKHIFWNPELKRKDIKNFVDKFFLMKENRIAWSNSVLNDNICNAMSNFGLIESFSYYLANTINNEDDIALMKACPEFAELSHCSMVGVPFEDVKDEGMKITNRAIDIIKDSKKYIGYEHGLTNSFKASEAINPRQYKEVRFNIGTKPNNEGGVYPYVIDKSFSSGGVNDPLSYFIESSTGRSAQIMSKTNVGDSGSFARLLGLNNIDTLLNFDASYECMTQNYVEFNIKSAKHLSMIKDRYYRENIRGIERVIDADNDSHLIGRKIYLRSPMTCQCNSDNNHICHKCYGDLYYTNIDINAGKMAAEILSSQLTQKLLSAKHLLEVKIAKIIWCEAFYTFFQIDINAIVLHRDLIDANLKGYEIIIDPEDVVLVDNGDYSISYDGDDEEFIPEDNNYSEYIEKFVIHTPNDEYVEISSEGYDNLYLSTDFNDLIRKKAYNKDDKIVVPMSAVAGSDDEELILFYIKVNNNELSKTMNDIINVINKAKVLSTKTKDEALQDIVDMCIEGGLSIDSVHIETLLSNQIVDPNNIIKKVNWSSPNAAYRLITLNQSLTNNPSIVISLLYQDIQKVLYNPLSFSKRGSSFFDLFYMEKPQNYISDELLIDDPDIREEEKAVKMVRIVK